MKNSSDKNIKQHVSERVLSRREALFKSVYTVGAVGAAVSVAAMVSACTNQAPAPVSNAGDAGAAGAQPQTYVLVHGAWHGAWCWRDVRTKLERAGHRVFTPTLTGQGERHHLSSATVDLNTHIRDVVAVIEAEELTNVILVGHSYGGYPIAGVAQLVPSRIASLVYLDAMMPTVGRAANQAWSPQLLEVIEKSLIEGYKLPSLPPAMFDISPSDTANSEWLKRRLTDMPYKCLSMPFPDVKVDAAAYAKITQRYIKCTETNLDGSKSGVITAQERGIKIEYLKSGHNAMVTASAALVEMLLAS
jgi:pimeloyl-ACP methyl ester carboxylesterase